MKEFFRFQGTDDDGTNTFLAKIELPNDGTPDSERFLQIQVDTGTDEYSVISLSIVSPKLKKTQIIGTMKTRNVIPVVDLLYPSATLKTIVTIIPKILEGYHE